MNKPLSKLQFLAGETWYQIRQAISGPLLPIMFFGLFFYMWMVLLNANYMREMGAVGGQYNSASIVYIMASGQALWLFFAWAWLFAQAISRDQQAMLHEVVLATPVSLPLLLLARYLGLLVVAVLLGCAVLAGIITSPLLVTFGLLPPEAIGLTPWRAIFLGVMLFIVPSAIGIGALHLSAAIWARGASGSFSVAALLALIWMIAMIVLRSSDVNLALASTVDPSAFAEVERQNDNWTAAEKAHARLEITPMLLINRFLWGFVPLFLLGGVLLRLSRESLVLARKPAVIDIEPLQRANNLSQPIKLNNGTANWWRSTWLEAGWHLRLTLSGFGFRLVMLMLILVGTIGSWVNFVARPDGPAIPYLQPLLPFMTEFFYLILLFVVLGFVGSLMRRDDHLGIGEWLDATPAPLGVRVVAKALAMLALVLLILSLPAVASLIIAAIGTSQVPNFILPFAYEWLLMAPALAELAALAFLAHVLFRHAGLAYSISILVGFIAIVNHEIGVIEYPPAQIGIPPHVHLSELTGWAPWLSMVASFDGLKLSLVIFVIGLAWLVWCRGTAISTGQRLAVFAKRLRQPAGGLTVFGLLALMAFATKLYHQLVTEGGYQSVAVAQAVDAEWERKWWHQATPFSLRSGQIRAVLRPAQRSAEVIWQLQSLSLPNGKLHATLPDGLKVVQIKNGEQSVNYQVDGDHLMVDVPNCRQACDLDFNFSVALRGWRHDEVPWLHGSGIWLRAKNILPKLGHDPERLLRSPVDRHANGLPVKLPLMPAADTLTPVQAVAPKADWRWQITVDESGHTIGTQGSSKTALDFAFVWLPQNRHLYKYSSSAMFSVWHSQQRAAVAARLSQDIADMNACVNQRLATVVTVDHAVQVPADLGAIALYNHLLWLTEDTAWEVTGEGLGGILRLADIGIALAKAAVFEHTDLRDEVGNHWLLEGLAGWTALNCIDELRGHSDGLALREQMANDVMQAMAAITVPITTAAASHADWLADYAALSLDSWSLMASRINEKQLLAQLLPQIAEQSLPAALSTVIGKEDATRLLGAPHSYDVSISNTSSGIVLSGQRWVWQQGGWQSLTSPQQLVRKQADSDTVDSVDINALDDSLANGYFFDAESGFERSVSDNRMR